MLKTVFIFEWKKLRANTAFYLSTGLLLLIGFYSLYNGRQVIRRQQHNIQLAINRENTIFNDIVAQLRRADTTTEAKKSFFYHATDAGWNITSPNKRWTSYWRPAPLSFLSLGNRDVYPYYHELEPYSFYMRFFKNEISSPFQLLYGHLDLAFVILLFFPLFIIAFTFDVFSAEREQGTYVILQAVTLPSRIIYAKLAFYTVISLALLNILLLSAFGFGNVPAAAWLQYAGAANAYIVFWLLLSGAFSLLRRSSVTNAILLVSCWLLLTIALPAVFNAWAGARYPVNSEMFSPYIRRVQMTDNPNEQKKRLAEFYRYYPQYAHTDTTGPSYFNKLYTAYGNLNDRHADPLLQIYFRQMRRRESFLEACNTLNPYVMCQQRLNHLADTDLSAYLAYVSQARAYLQVLKEDLTQKCFNGVPLTLPELEHRYTFDQFLQQQSHFRHHVTSY